MNDKSGLRVDRLLKKSPVEVKAVIPASDSSDPPRRKGGYPKVAADQSGNHFDAWIPVSTGIDMIHWLTKEHENGRVVTPTCSESFFGKMPDKPA